MSAFLYAGCYLAALAMTLVLAAHLTPRHWWRRLNLRALAVTLAGTVLLGQLASRYALPMVVPLAEQQAGTSAPSRITPLQPPMPMPAAPFAVHRDLNLRWSASVAAPRMLTVPAGALVMPTGQRHGDWWQISACVAGQCSTGWASSLWLRRSEEQPPHHQASNHAP